ncbi:MAG: HD domain-containing phosphohydrolase [Dehalococcoidia bacterium]
MADLTTELEKIEEEKRLNNYADFNHISETCYENEEDILGNNMYLVYEISRKAALAYDLTKLLNDIVFMVEKTIKASASSVLLFDEEKDELYFDIARGTAQDSLKHIRIDAKSGIAGWVAHHGKPLIANDVANDPRFNQHIDTKTGFVTKSILCIPLVVHRKIIGVIEVLNKKDGSDFTKKDLGTLLPVASFAAMVIENAKLQESVLNGYRSTIKALAAAVDAKDPYTCGHSQRVMAYALSAGIQLSLAQDELAILEYGAVLHDIGKIGIDDRIIRKPGPLDPSELESMREHPVIGAKMIEGIPFLEKAKTLILHHHERYDGTGYPHRLAGDEISVSAQLIAVADSFDTMTTDRAYRTALSVPYTMKELRRCAGTQFCKIAVDAFVDGYDQYYGKSNFNFT